MLDKDNLTPRQRTMRSLLHRAFEQNRGAEMILLIQWRLAQESHKNVGFAKLARKFLFDEGNATQPRAIRALNLIAKEEGVNVIYRDAETGAPPKPKIDVQRFLKDMPKEEQIRLTWDRPQTALLPMSFFGVQKGGDIAVPAEPPVISIRPLSDQEKSLRKMFKPYGEQRDVRMEEIPDKVVSKPDDLALAAAALMPKGYLPH
jgi:hypothetical protein